jgi:uncharacterized protein
MSMIKSKKILWIVVVVILLPIIYFLFIYEKPLPRPEIKPRPNMVEPDNHQYSFENPPIFTKEGELRFLSAKSNEIISQIDVEIADTHFERALGLMFRPEMEENHGMLFKFDYEEIQAFYMRNTVIPLDIIYVNMKGEIVKIYENTEILNDRSLPSDKPAIYVVEVNGGYCQAHNIGVGDKIEFN